MKSVILWCFALLEISHAAFKLEERYSWNQLDFVFPTRAMKDIALASGTYIPQNALPVGVENWGNKLFVTVPRWRDGNSNFGFLFFFPLKRTPNQMNSFRRNGKWHVNLNSTLILWSEYIN